jgi:hypothetical protein
LPGSSGGTGVVLGVNEGDAVGVIETVTVWVTVVVAVVVGVNEGVSVRVAVGMFVKV